MVRASVPARRSLAVLMAGIATIAIAAEAPAMAADAPSDDTALPESPLLTRGRLDNGVTYWVHPLRAPAGSVSVWLRIGSGSLNEAPDQRGLAHFVEHMAFSGTQNFPRGEAIRYFESLGLRFGQDENGSTDLRDTVFQLALPDARAETMRRALALMSDFVSRQTLRPEEIARERAVILEELHATQGLAERVDERLRALVYAGSRIVERPPRGDPAVIRAAGRAELLRYLTRWYRPDDTTVMVAGDVDPALVVPLITDAFGGWRASVRRPVDATAGIRFPSSGRAAVITDAEMPLARISLDWLAPPSPLRTTGDYRRRLVDDLAVAVLERRLDRRAGRTARSFQSAYVASETAFGAARQTSVQAFSRAALWRDALRDVLEELGAARLNGCDAAALDDALRARLARAEREARNESARDARDVLAEMREALAEQRVPLSRAQALALDRALAPGITTAEVSAALAQLFTPEARSIALVLPRRADLPVPTRAQIVALARAVEAPGAIVAARGDQAEASIDRLLDSEPEPPPDAAAALHGGDAGALDGVSSLTLANGVRVHLRPMSRGAGASSTLELQITLGGGELLESAATRGLSAAAALAFAHPATARRPAGALRRYLREHDISPWGCACEGDGITLGISTDATSAEEALRLAHLELREGRIDPAAFRVWKDRQLESAAGRGPGPERQLDERVQALLAAGDARARRPRADEIARIDLGASQRWLDRHLASAPIEVALVGDLPLEEMRRLAIRYLGSLPARATADPALQARRHVPLRSGPAEATIAIEPLDADATRAAVEIAWRGAEAHDARDRQVLDLAAQIISDRLIEELRERRGLAYRFSCDATPALGLEGTGTLTVQASTEPRHVHLVARLARELVERLAREGPTADQLAIARRQRLRERARDEHDLDFWADTLSTLDVRGISLADVAAEPVLLSQIDAADVRAVLGRYVSSERRFEALALPRSSYTASAAVISSNRSNSVQATPASRQSRASVLPRTAKTRSDRRAAGKSSRPSPT